MDNTKVSAVNSTATPAISSWNSGPDPATLGASVSRLNGSSSASNSSSLWDTVDAEDSGTFAHAGSLADSWGLGGDTPKASDSSSDNSSGSGSDSSSGSDGSSSAADKKDDANDKLRPLAEKAEGEVRDGGQPGDAYKDLESAYGSADRQQLSQAMQARVEGALLLGKMHKESKQREDERNGRKAQRSSRYN